MGKKDQYLVTLDRVAIYLSIPQDWSHRRTEELIKTVGDFSNIELKRPRDAFSANFVNYVGRARSVCFDSGTDPNIDEYDKYSMDVWKKIWSKANEYIPTATFLSRFDIEPRFNYGCRFIYNRMMKIVKKERKKPKYSVNMSIRLKHRLYEKIVDIIDTIDDVLYRNLKYHWAINSYSLDVNQEHYEDFGSWCNICFAGSLLISKNIKHLLDAYVGAIHHRLEKTIPISYSIGN